MLFKTDENMPKSVAELLTQAGHPTMRVDEQAMTGFVDKAVIAVCTIEQRVLLTLDTDFLDNRRFPPERFAGIIVLRPKRQSIRKIVEMIRQIIPLLESEVLRGKLWIIDDGRMRIRPETAE